MELGGARLGELGRDHAADLPVMRIGRLLGDGQRRREELGISLDTNSEAYASLLHAASCSAEADP